MEWSCNETHQAINASKFNNSSWNASKVMGLSSGKGKICYKDSTNWMETTNNIGDEITIFKRFAHDSSLVSKFLSQLKICHAWFWLLAESLDLPFDFSYARTWMLSKPSSKWGTHLLWSVETIDSGKVTFSKGGIDPT